MITLHSCPIYTPYSSMRIEILSKPLEYLGQTYFKTEDLQNCSFRVLFQRQGIFRDVDGIPSSLQELESIFCTDRMGIEASSMVR